MALTQPRSQSFLACNRMRPVVDRVDWEDSEALLGSLVGKRVVEAWERGWLKTNKKVTTSGTSLILCYMSVQNRCHGNVTYHAGTNLSN